MWYSVHIVKLKKFKTCIKQNTGEKISYSSRDTQVGKSSPSFDYSLCSVPNRNDHTYQNNTDVLVLGVFKRTINIGFYITITNIAIVHSGVKQCTRVVIPFL